MLRNAGGVGGLIFPGKKGYEGVGFNVVSITRGWVGVRFPGKKRYATLEWPLRHYNVHCCLADLFKKNMRGLSMVSAIS